MLNKVLSDNPIWQYVSHNAGIIKTISLNTPATSLLQEAHMSIVWDQGIHQAEPNMEKADISSPNAIIEQRKSVSCTSWTRRANTEIRIYLPQDTTPQKIETWMSEIGWVIGAGYMYRWIFAKSSRPPDHDFGGDKYNITESNTANGDISADLAKQAEENGYYSWEINCAYHKQYGLSKHMWTSWQKKDPTLTNNGNRESSFPGWKGYHPWLQGGNFESHFYFCNTKKKEAGALYSLNVFLEKKI